MTQIMKIPKNCYFILLFLITYLFFHSSENQDFDQTDNYEGSSNLVEVEYHMGPVLASPNINIYIIWYGHWYPNHQSTIKDFLYSLSSPAPFPSVSDWWSTVRLYTDQTGANISGNLVLSGEHYDTNYSHGKYLTRLTIQSIIKSSISQSSINPKPLFLNYKNGVYLVLSSWDVQVQDFCREVCGFHYFTFPNIVGVTVPYAWVGYSGAQCPGLCAFPFAWPKYSPRPPPGVGNIIGPPNGDAGVDGMISVLAHELAEMSSNPLVNAWYAGDDPSTPSEIADLCMGVYGSGGGGGYIGQVYKDSRGNGFNLNGVNERRFLLQWVWNPVKKSCFGPNAID